MSDIAVFVKARLLPSDSGVYAVRRYRCGMGFDAEGHTVSVTAGELEILKADPLLVVTEVDATEVATTEAPQAATAETPATETDKTAAKADKKAG
jgi:hypothetical protein